MNRLFILCVAALILVSCGTSGERDTRPIEKIFYVRGTQTTEGPRFRIHNITATNADHEFDSSQVLQGPYFFVLENAIPPVSAIFEGIDDGATVTLARGTALIRSEIPLIVGTCIRLSTDDSMQGPVPCPTPTGTVPASDHACANLLPNSDSLHRPEICTDVYSVEGTSQIEFSATVGDEKASNQTFCMFGSINEHDLCTVPASFFIEEPTASVSLVFNKGGNLNVSGQFQGDLYINGHREKSEKDGKTVVVSADL